MLAPLCYDLWQIALICYVKELSERSRKLDTNVFDLALGDRFRKDPDVDTSVQRRLFQSEPLSTGVFQLDTFSHTHRLEKFLQGQFGTDPRIWSLERVCKFRWQL